MMFIHVAVLLGTLISLPTLTTASPPDPSLSESILTAINEARLIASSNKEDVVALLKAANKTDLDELLPSSQRLNIVDDTPPTANQKRQDGDDPRCLSLRSEAMPYIPYLRPLQVTNAFCITPKTPAFICTMRDDGGQAHSFLAT